MIDLLLPLVLALLGGGAVYLVFAGLAGRPARVPRAQQATILPGIQVRIDRARLGADAGTYMTRSLLYGAGFGLFTAVATGAWLTFPVGVLAGFAFVWSQLEDRRNEQLNQYHKGLASAADTIANSWLTRPSLDRALEAVATYGQDAVGQDFERVRLAVRGGTSLAAALQEIADERQSPIFDALATALLVAQEHGGEVGPVLVGQAHATRRMAMIYEEAIDEQRGQRADTRVGILGPWAIMFLLRVTTLTSGGLGYGTEFFTTPLGQVAALLAVLLTIAAFVHAHRTASRGLIVERVALERGKSEGPVSVPSRVEAR